MLHNVLLLFRKEYIICFGQLNCIYDNLFFHFLVQDKFELVDVMPVIMMSESGRRYTHVNFTAKSSKEGSPEKLFFAELHNCGKSRARSGFLVTFCEPLGSDTTGECPYSSIR